VARLDAWLTDLEKKGGSDLHLAAGLAPRMRCRGALIGIEGQPDLNDGSLRELLREIVSDAQWQE
jgi:twitching motility protein PilT